jgi:hypothetical protein
MGFGVKGDVSLEGLCAAKDVSYPGRGALLTLRKQE